MIAASRAAANRVSTNDSTVYPEITNSTDAQDEADRQNIFRLAAIGVKEGITEGITKVFRKYITNPILQTMEDRDFKSVDQYQIHKDFTAITEGVEAGVGVQENRRRLQIVRRLL